MKRRRCEEKLIALRIIHVILLLDELRLMSIAVGCLGTEGYTCPVKKQFSQHYGITAILVLFFK